MSSWPEKVSAFTPDDLYRNLLGVKIAGGIIRGGGSNSHDEYNHSMDAWIDAVLERLGAVPEDEAEAAMLSVDGIWWDSSKKLPDWRLVTRRYMDIDQLLSPWLVSDATPPPPEDRRFDGCPEDAEPLVLRNPQGFEGIPFTDYLTLEFEVGDVLVNEGFPFPRPPSRLVTQADFPFIIQKMREEWYELLGPNVDRP